VTLVLKVIYCVPINQHELYLCVIITHMSVVAGLTVLVWSLCNSLYCSMDRYLLHVQQVHSC